MQITADAKLGTTRQIANSQYNTAEVVNAAITVANGAQLDLAYAENYLRYYGNSNPAPEMVEAVAWERALLREVGRLTGSNADGQMGKWDLSSAATILASFDSYLNRRIQGQRARYGWKHSR